MADESRPAGRVRSRLDTLVYDSARPSAWPAACVLLVFIPLIYSTMLLDGDTAAWLIEEKHPIELLGALGLLVASIASFVLWRGVRGDQAWPRLRRLSLLGYGLLFFFGAGEELSWGQRIFGIETPASLSAVNEQEELNIHNLPLFNSVINTNTLFSIFWLVTGVVVPVVALWPTARRGLERFLPVLPVALSGLFILNQVSFWGFEAFLTRYPERFHSSYPLVYSLVEIKETVAALLLGVGFSLILLRHRRTRMVE